jgi:hypothetical protein
MQTRKGQKRAIADDKQASIGKSAVFGVTLWHGACIYPL